MLNPGKRIGAGNLKTSKKIDAFVAGIGTGGTYGRSVCLKEKHPRVKIIGVEAAETHHQMKEFLMVLSLKF